MCSEEQIKDKCNMCNAICRTDFYYAGWNAICSSDCADKWDKENNE